MFNILTVIKKWFKGLDKNNDGVVNAADAVVAIKNVADVNNDGVVNFADVKAAAAAVKATVVGVADVNNDGVVDAADVKAAAVKVKEKIKMTRSQLNAMSKHAIQTHGKNIGVELDRIKLTKRQMIDALLKSKI